MISNRFKNQRLCSCLYVQQLKLVWIKWTCTCSFETNVISIIQSTFTDLLEFLFAVTIRWQTRLCVISETQWEKSLRITWDSKTGWTPITDRKYAKEVLQQITALYPSTQSWYAWLPYQRLVLATPTLITNNARKTLISNWFLLWCGGPTEQRWYKTTEW